MVVSQVETPNVVVVLDHTLLKYDEVTSGLGKGGWLIVNSWRHPRELDLGGDFNIATADATKICSSLGLIVAGLTVVNTNSEVGINLAAIAQTYKITKLEKIR